MIKSTLEKQYEKYKLEVTPEISFGEWKECVACVTVEKKTKVCTDCITLMSEADYEEHNGKCQLCRGGAVEDTGLYLFCVLFNNGDETVAEHVVSEVNNWSTVEQRFIDEFRDEHDYEPEWCDTSLVSVGSRYNIRISRNLDF